MTYKKRDYQDPTYKRFRTDVLKRDKFTCQLCQNKNKKNLHVHHIIEWAKATSLRYDVGNGICLCRECHESVTGQEHVYQKLFLEIVMQNEKRKRKK